MTKDNTNMILEIAKAGGFRTETMPTFGDCVFLPRYNPASLTPQIKNVIRETLLLAEQYGIEYVANECGISLDDD